LLTVCVPGTPENVGGPSHGLSRALVEESGLTHSVLGVVEHSRRSVIVCSSEKPISAGVGFWSLIKESPLSVPEI
jgi:hypothetical protein